MLAMWIGWPRPSRWLAASLLDVLVAGQQPLHALGQRHRGRDGVHPDLVGAYSTAIDRVMEAMPPLAAV